MVKKYSMTAYQASVLVKSERFEPLWNSRHPWPEKIMKILETFILDIERWQKEKIRESLFLRVEKKMKTL